MTGAFICRPFSRAAAFEGGGDEPYHPNHVPMFRHQRQQKYFNRIPRESFTQHAEKCFMVLLFVKDDRPRISAMEVMANRTAFMGSFVSGHGQLSLTQVFSAEKCLIRDKIAKNYLRPMFR